MSATSGPSARSHRSLAAGRWPLPRAGSVLLLVAGSCFGSASAAPAANAMTPPAGGRSAAVPAASPALATALATGGRTDARQDRRDDRDDAGAATGLDAVRARLDDIAAAVAAGDLEVADAIARADAIFDEVLAWGGAVDPDGALLADAAFVRRLLRLASAAPAGRTADAASYFRRTPRLARALAFTWLLDHPGDDPAAVLGVLDRLAGTGGDRLDDYAELVAAICVVHDRPVRARVNENVGQASAPEDVLAYFVRNEGRMTFGVRDVPASLLVHVVDAAAPVDDLAWALDRYGNRRDVGDRYFEIDYDHQHLRHGSAKGVTRFGFTLEHILQYGGVCADQAHFACTVGKALGTPAAYVVGRSGEVGHAWVGYLETGRGNRAWWNFDAGRYPAYRGVRGVIRDAQRGRSVPDSSVAMLADLALVDRAGREAAAARLDGARRLAEIAEDPRLRQDWPPARPAWVDEADVPAAGSRERDRRDRNRRGRRDRGDDERAGDDAEPAESAESADSTRPRTPDARSRLAILQQAIEAAPAYAPAWLEVAAMAEDGALELDDKRRWATALDRLCGARFPDFQFDVLSSLIEAVDDPVEQDRIWEAAAPRFRVRKDLSAELLVRRARLRREAGFPAEALQMYEEVIARHADDGPFVLSALAEAATLIRTEGDPRMVTPLYERAWSTVERPGGRMAAVFARQSNWYRIGAMLAERLEREGDADRARRIRLDLERTIGAR